MTTRTLRPPMPFADPLRCLWAAHEAFLDFCRDFEEFCRDPGLWGDRRAARRLHDVLAVDVGLHAGDEDEDLLPALRRVGLLAGDDAVVALAESEHARDRRLIARLLPELRRLIGGEACDEARLAVGGIAFAQTYRRHIAFETRHLMPLAEALDGDGQGRLLAAMAARRGA